MTEAQEQRQTEALNRALNNSSPTNEATVIDEFARRGIYDALPRVNVFTYQAWQKLGRQVRRGQHGVRIVTYIPCKSKPDDNGERQSFRRPKKVTVFHVSQTDPIN